MKLNRDKLYSLLFIVCLAGYIWIYLSTTTTNDVSKSAEVCLIKTVTNLPCPSCGSTRSVISLIKGDFIGALNLNPIGYIIAFIMLVAPVWIITDIILKKTTLLNVYQKVETHLKNPKIAIPLIILLIINWIWNINKGL